MTLSQLGRVVVQRRKLMFKLRREAFNSRKSVSRGATSQGFILNVVRLGGSLSASALEMNNGVPDQLDLDIRGMLGAASDLA